MKNNTALKGLIIRFYNLWVARSLSQAGSVDQKTRIDFHWRSGLSFLRFRGLDLHMLMKILADKASERRGKVWADDVRH